MGVVMSLLISSCLGPKTVFFWAPMFKWVCIIFLYKVNVVICVDIFSDCSIGDSQIYNNEKMALEKKTIYIIMLIFRVI